MEQEKALDILEKAGVMQSGHFKLTSGKHSDRYMQCARLFETPAYSEALCRDLAERFRGEVDVVAGPAIGGIIMAYEVARALGVRNIFAERENGAMTLRRGFFVKPGERALIVEDVVTTGGSVKEVAALLAQMGAQIVGVGAIVDRSGGKAGFGCRFEAAAAVALSTYEPDDCPLCAQGIPVHKPGSRA
jgi:orotate phosphoribosyltransferase